MMKTCFITLIIGISILFSSDSLAIEKNTIQVLKNGDNVFIRSYYSKTEDVVLQVGKGTNEQINFSSATLVPSKKKMTRSYKGKKGVRIHACGDDATPWKLTTTYIGGNHGCSDGRELTIKKHKLTEKDIGSEWEDGKGNKFYILKIIDRDKIWILSENIGKGDIWNFHRKIDGKKLVNTKNKKTLEFSDFKMCQLTPCCRFLKQAYLIDGKTPLKDGKVVKCEFLDIIDDYEIICPDSLIDFAKKEKGKTLDFTGEKLDAFVRNEIRYRFQPMGACVVLHKSEVLKDFNIGYMGFIQTSPLYKNSFDTHEYYIPKTLPFETGGVKYDFAGIQDYSNKFSAPLNFMVSQKNIADPSNLPDRFIQFLGEKKRGKAKRKVGYVAGYSLTEGMTIPESRAKNTKKTLMLYTSKKTYPSALDSKAGKVIPKKSKFDCVAYRQYFDPEMNEEATSLYWNKQGDDYILYADFHKAAEKCVIALPKHMIGKKISIVEQTPSVKLLSGNKTSKKGISISSKDDYGYIVLRISSK